MSSKSISNVQWEYLYIIDIILCYYIVAVTKLVSNKFLFRRLLYVCVNVLI